MISGIKEALQSMDGLSTGDAFGEQYFFVGGIVALRSPVPIEWINQREPNPGF